MFDGPEEIERVRGDEHSYLERVGDRLMPRTKRSRRARFTANMLTPAQKLYLRAGMSHPPGSVRAEQFNERLDLARKTGEPRWLNWAGNLSLSKIVELVRHLPYVAEADGESRTAIDEATAIVRSASGDVIDWTKEPMTERERKIRNRIIANITARSLVPALDLRGLVGFGDRPRIASDLRAAIQEMETLQDDRRRERRRAEI